MRQVFYLLLVAAAVGVGGCAGGQRQAAGFEQTTPALPSVQSPTTRAAVVPGNAYLDESVNLLSAENKVIEARAAVSHAVYIASYPQHLLLKLDYATTVPAAHDRPALNIALVLDRSASMAEDRKLPYTIEAARAVVDNMSDRDFISIVAFNERVVVLSPAGRVVNKNFLYHRLHEISPEGTTDLSAGLLEGIAQINAQSAAGQLRHLLLLTDGLANRGITDTDGLRRIVEKARANGVGVSTLGCGTEFNERLLTGLAAAGGGRYTYIKSPEQIPLAFKEELQGLLQVVAQNVSVEVEVAGGEISHMYGQLLERSVNSYKLNIGSLRAGERGVLLLKLRPLRYEPGAVVDVIARLSFDDPQTGKRVINSIPVRSSFTKDNRALVENTDIMLYGRVLDALESAEQAERGLDVERYKSITANFAQLYQEARQHALQNRDQELLNQTFLLKHFMEELATAADQGLLHGHGKAREKLKKEFDYQRYLLLHHGLQQ